MTIIVRMFLNVLLCFIIPKNWLKKKVTHILAREVFPRYRSVIYFKSGRAALRGLLQGLNKLDHLNRIILLPDYICNVVYQTAESAGYEIITYQTDDDLKPVWDDLIHMLHNYTSPVVLLASLFGTVNAIQANINTIRRSNKSAFIIADECQFLVRNSPIGCDENMAIIFSFNKKTLPGVMGGGVFVRNPDLYQVIVAAPTPLLSSIELDLRLIFHLLREIFIYIKITLQNEQIHDFYVKAYEYSESKGIVYDTQPHEIAKVSLVRAWLELKNLQKYEHIRLINYQTIKEEFVEILEKPKLSYQMLAPNIPIKRTTLSCALGAYVFIKKPYAMHNNRKKANREIYCLMNSCPLPWHLYS